MKRADEVREQIIIASRGAKRTIRGCEQQVRANRKM
jgi:hypothetical protein